MLYESRKQLWLRSFYFILLSREHNLFPHLEISEFSSFFISRKNFVSKDTTTAGCFVYEVNILFSKENKNFSTLMRKLSPYLQKHLFLCWDNEIINPLSQEKTTCCCCILENNSLVSQANKIINPSSWENDSDILR